MWIFVIFFEGLWYSDLYIYEQGHDHKEMKLVESEKSCCSPVNSCSDVTSFSFPPRLVALLQQLVVCLHSIQLQRVTKMGFWFRQRWRKYQRILSFNNKLSISATAVRVRSCAHCSQKWSQEERLCSGEERRLKLYRIVFLDDMCSCCQFFKLIH